MPDLISFALSFSTEERPRQPIDWKSETRKPKTEFIEVYKQIDGELKNENNTSST